MRGNVNEECGVFGIWQPEEGQVAQIVYHGLVALQHRGEEAAGIAVNRGRVITCDKDLGLVSEVFTRERLSRLGPGNMAVGHVRYSTSGFSTKENAQPMLVKHIKGQLAITHNGNLVNSSALRRELEEQGCIFHTTSDTEVISYIITRQRLVTPSIEAAVEKAMGILDGAYSLVLMSPAKLIAVRDPHGFKPLCMGRIRETGAIVFASETSALAAVGAQFERDIRPGEIVVVEAGQVRSITDHCDTEKRSLCIFEHIYFARPDSKIDGVYANDFRVEAGKSLARSEKVDAAIVIGVPDSGLSAALGYSEESGLQYEIGLIKNKYIGRSFIAPSQEERADMVHMKLSCVEPVVKGKRVVLIDDSIVRGTTSAQIVKLLKDAGAKEVHMRISSPPFMNPCYYGTDIDSREHLIACRMSIPEISDFIGADSLAFLKVDAARDILARLMQVPEEQVGVCTACFDGKYPTAVPEHYEKNRFETREVSA